MTGTDSIMFSYGKDYENVCETLSYCILLLSDNMELFELTFVSFA